MGIDRDGLKAAHHPLRYSPAMNNNTETTNNSSSAFVEGIKRGLIFFYIYIGITLLFLADVLFSITGKGESNFSAWYFHFLLIGIIPCLFVSAALGLIIACVMKWKTQKDSSS